MIFLTVGTQFPFDRLVKAVDEAVEKGFICEELFAQLGESSYKPRNFEGAKSIDKQLFDHYVQRSSGIIGHAGIGTITMALNHSKPLLVMPRMKRYKEHVNDHQIATSRRFEELGHILAAYETEDLQRKIERLKSFVPRPRNNQAKEVAYRISAFLHQIDNSLSD